MMRQEAEVIKEGKRIDRIGQKGAKIDRKNNYETTEVDRNV